MVGLRYDAPSDCPDAERFSSHVRSRSSNLSVQPEADASEDAVDVQVQPAPEAPGWLGRVTIAGPLALDREVRGARCDDVVAALALITVLRLEGGDASALVAPVAGTTTSSSGGTSTTSTTGGVTGGGVPSAATEASEPATSATSETRSGGNEASARAEAEDPGPTAAARPEQSRPEQSQPEQSQPEQSQPEQQPLSPERAPPQAVGIEPPAAATPRSDPSMPALEENAASEGPGPQSAGESVARNAAAARETAPELPAPLAPDPAVSATDAEAGSLAADSSASVPARPSWQWPSVSAAAVALRAGYASVPGRAFKGALEAELHLSEGWVSELSLAHARGKDEVAVAKLDLSLSTLDVGLCPLVLGADSVVWLRACAGVRAGALHLAISPTQAGLSEATVWRPWLSLGPSLRVGVPLSERWTLRGLAELAVQLVRDNFDVALTPADGAASRRVTVYRPEALSIELGLGVGYSF